MDSTAAANLALGRLGVGQAIAALTDNSVPARTCNRFFAQCRQEVLRAFPWPFAERAETLALVAGQSFPGWTYVYAYPNDCLAVRAVADEGGLRWMRNPIVAENADASPILRPPWRVALKDDGASQVLLSDVPDAWAFFTVDVTNTGAWSPDFGSLFAWRLAMEVGGPLQAKRDLVDAAEQRYFAWLSSVSAVAMNEQRDDTRAESPSITCRM